MPYRVIFVGDIVGKKIVRKFLDSCPNELTIKILRQLKYLQEFGITNANPNLKKLTNTPFWEIRILGRQNIRIFCTNYKKLQIIVIHIFFKKTTKTPQQKIAKAQQLLKKVLDI